MANKPKYANISDAAVAVVHFESVIDRFDRELALNDADIAADLAVRGSTELPATPLLTARALIFLGRSQASASVRLACRELAQYATAQAIN